MKKSKLINLRKTKKFSQADLAAYLKISQTQYQKREIGKMKITAEEWQKIANLLDVSQEDIYESSYYSNEKSLLEEIEFLKEKIKDIEQRIISGY